MAIIKEKDRNVRVIVADRKYDCEHLIGMFLNESHYDTLINEDCDVYMPANCDVVTQSTCDTPRDCSSCDKGTNELKIAFKFRKNFFSKEIQDEAYIGLRQAAVRTENRGLASGIKEGVTVTDNTRIWVTNYQYDMLAALKSARVAALDDEDVIDTVRAKYPTAEDRKLAGGGGKNFVWVIDRFPEQGFGNGFDFDSWVDSIKPLDREQRADSTEKVSTMMSTTTYGIGVNSGIAGWFDRYPRIPYGRTTNYTRDNPELFARAYPFLQTLAVGFKELLPWRYNNQMKAAETIDHRFRVPGTPFTTLTVNKTFRTAAHYDAGDFTQGLSNLLVLSNNGNYTGGYLVAPEYRIAVNVRPGDLLLINNHEVLHGNTEIVLQDEQAERISLVCYLREGMLSLGSYEYENCRFEYVESRRLNKNHPLQRSRWNGISPGMWSEQAWFDYCAEKIGHAEMLKYHPESVKQSSLEDFF